MGLDQVAFLVPKDSNAVIVHDGSPPPINVVELVKDKYPDPNEAGITTLWRWRKHADLQAWMTRLFHHRGGKGNFNVAQDVRVEAIDLDDLERDMESGLDKGEGFFWGESLPSDTKSTKKFIKVAREHLEKGDMVYYSSWY